MAQPMDVAKVAWVVMQGGCWQGRQFLPQDYLKEAVSKQIATVTTANDLVDDSGYGYQFWQVKNNGYGMFGMGGQLAICFPEKDLLLVTCDTQMTAGVMGSFSIFLQTIFANLSGIR